MQQKMIFKNGRTKDRACKQHIARANKTVTTKNVIDDEKHFRLFHYAWPSHRVQRSGGSGGGGYGSGGGGCGMAAAAASASAMASAAAAVVWTLS